MLRRSHTRRWTGRIAAAITATAAITVGLIGIAVPASAAEETGTIDGVITGAEGAVLGGVNVQLFLCDPDRDDAAPDCWTLLDVMATTAADGSFAIDQLEPGTYRAVIHPQTATREYVYEYWDGAQDIDAATDITVSAGETATITPTLDIGGTISGTVVDEAGDPVSDGYVYAWLTTNTGGTRGGASVAADGSYTISGLPAGDYILEAGPSWSSDSPLLSEYWEDADSEETATVLELAAQEQATANFELNNGAVVEGTVTADGAPLAGVQVTASKAESGDYWSTAGTATTTADGTYSIEGLEKGDYRVRFADFGGDYAYEYWQDAVDAASATVLSLVPGVTADGIDAALTAGGTITGTLTQKADGAAVPAANGYADVLRKDADGDWDRVTSVTAGEDGTYAAAGLPDGEYTVLAYGGSGGGWAWTYLGGVYYGDEADSVEVTGTAIIDDVDVETPLGVSIKGTIRDEAGGPADDARIDILFEKTPGQWVAPPPHGAAGDPISYMTNGMPPGNYVVKFSSVDGAESPYQTQYWENAATQATATVLDGTSGGSFTGISAVMRKIAPVEAVTPTISGVAQVGQELTAVPGDWESDVTLAYQWFADDEAISGATDVSFAPSDAQIGDTLTVRVTGSREAAEPASATSAATAAVTERFADAAAAGSHAANVRWVAAEGAVDGIRGEDGIVRYDPKAPATRGTMAIALYRLLGSPEFDAPATPTFSDVTADDEAYVAVEYLSSVHALSGYGDGTFRADTELRRDHAAALLFRAAAPSFTAPASATFTDVTKASTYYSAVEWLSATHITGVKGSYGPSNTVSRGELATFITRWAALQG